MKLRIKSLNLLAGRPVAILHKRTADKIGINISDRIIIRKGKSRIVSVVDIATGMLNEEEIVVSNEIIKELNLKEREMVDITIAPHPESAGLIYKKFSCKALKKEEIKKIISDIVKNALTEAEIAYFVSAVYKCGMTLKETEYMIRSIISTGKKIELKGKVVDKHCIGGIAGNRTTPIIVAICAAAGLTMPKTSSRAITSAAGTADVIEILAKVDFNLNEIRGILKKTGACIVWGGSLGLAPADDKIIQIERILNLDPEPQLLASIISKKLAVDSNYILIDIPYGGSAKVSKKKALLLKNKFEELGKFFKVHLKCILTDGRQPIGNGIGPVLEIKDVMRVLRQNPSRPLDLEKKSVKLAGKILEMSGKAKRGRGEKTALEILSSGKALRKFEEIIIAQEGSLSNKKLKIAEFSKNIEARKYGKIRLIDNKRINLIARVLGCPVDKKAGIYLYNHIGDVVKKGQKIMTFYSESEDKLKEAIEFYKKIDPIKITD